ncbi:HNH endonuclease [Mobiluncus curtisii]|uniref:AP2 domain protein n=2 Tax=Mobiluncus curtisii TaxID=2051 RepID=D6ZG23_MOBCV|nr:HNH endonuclease [Mobiluncus curtisii]ADI67581.1 AP2 domain protein [Mobiluncus curtisii ATCC 43063]NMW89521.1 hypothetical protein [Mobiluncus curtisii]QQU08710.1 HNH endonuclease [Mobiluncus curtisii]SQB65095.1 AP2 domain [Mobiluncus curtisii]
MKTIPLTKGLVAVVDDADYSKLSPYSWYAVGRPGNEYAARYGGHNKGSSSHIRMHRELLNAPAGIEVDHVNGNRLDNRRANLRLATRTQNACNRSKFRGKHHSRFKGVTYHVRDQCWQASIRHHDKHIYLGSFESEVEAAAAYNKAAINYQGKFAKLNELQGENK